VFIRATLSLFLIPASIATANPLSFNRDVRPILAEHCYRCHGPDAATREADLRLDLPPDKVTGSVFELGDDATSELIKRITSSDPDFMMPPPESKLELDTAQIEVVKEWGEEGAEFERHWAFIPPKRTKPPRVKNKKWVRNPIDAFVLRRLEGEGIEPSPEADSETLLRRAAFDLTGVPPTIADMDTFANDPSFEKAIDRLIHSDVFGERMAADWLDVARYADTYGYQSDRDSRVWPWRDWVIHAFNDNKPYDQFIEEQVAGDLLPNATQDQILATAFNRLHRQTNEGGSVLEEWRVEYVADRTTTFGTAFLGMTFECARCHDHKFDPIDQEDFYETFAFFNNIDESGMYSHFTAPIPTPALLLYDDTSREAHKALQLQVDDKRRALEQVLNEAEPEFNRWIESMPNAVSIPNPVFALHFDDEDAIESLDTGIEDASAKLNGSPEAVTGHSGTALKFSGDNGIQINKAADFDRADAFSFSLWLHTSNENERAVVFHCSQAAEDAASRGYEMLIQGDRIEFALCHFWPGNAIRIRSDEAVSLKQWTHIAVTYDGSSKAAGVRLYINGQPVETEVIRDGLYKTIRYEGTEGGKPIIIGSRFRDSGLVNGTVDDFLGFDRELSALEIRALHGNAVVELDESDLGLWWDHYLVNVDKEVGSAMDSLAEARAEEAAYITRISEIMVMKELDQPRQAYLLERGHYANRAAPVSPDTPPSILPFDETLPRNRLGLAQWTTDPANPLTARVAVNRIWNLFFGQGLVETQEDFGLQGRPPTHPELLDYLATWFVDKDWDVKALCTLIATSATYRQSSNLRSELAERDPNNELLARGPRYRLSAEQIRDAALASSGLLVAKVGGPSVRPYQPEGLWKDAGSLTYKPDKGDGLYRRSMYTFWKRTVPPPDMLTFDAPTREACIARREQTTTPLQVLVLLNSTQFVEAARVLAQDVLSSYDSDHEVQIIEVVRRLLSRYPNKSEVKLLSNLFIEQQGIFQEDTEAATEFARIGTTKRNGALRPENLAAMTVVVQAVMNHDGFIMKI
jgi:hypothetical protein